MRFQLTLPDAPAKALFCLALSIAAAPIAVNASGETLSSFNKDKFDNASRQAKRNHDSLVDFSKLIKLVIDRGQEHIIPANLASAIGSPTGVPILTKDVQIEDRICTIAYSSETTTTDLEKHPIPDCVYLSSRRKSGRSLVSRYLRIDLNGKLQKVFVLNGTSDAQGRPLSATKSYPDVDSPEVRKEFQAEMDFWLKEWLPKQDGLKAKPIRTGSTTKASTGKARRTASDNHMKPRIFAANEDRP